ncbi:MAG: rRNA maturation RNase YbeY [Sulfurimonas sp.]|nr:rRNA maturation RNase YbeY [Sulfurimonas sp.]
MIELDNRTSLIINNSFLNSIAILFSNKEIELIIVDKDEMQEINKQFRDIDNSTDVLSFAFEDMPNAPLGSIIISSWHVQTKAKELGHTSDDEIALLFIHGLLHLLGYDHEIDNTKMREKEKELIKKFKLPNSLIIRTQGK